MFLNNSPYLLLFFPLIASLLCLLINFKKTDFWIFAGTLFTMLCLVVKIVFDFSQIKIPIKNDLGFGILSIPTEYYLDFLSLCFLAIALFASLFMAFVCNLNSTRSPKNNNSQLFYCVSLLNLFGLVGIFSTNNIFNLFIYIEIFCLTFVSIVAMSSDLELQKLSLNYFLKSAFASMLLLIAFVLLYVLSGSFQISKIANLPEIKNINLIFWIVVIAVFLKFFPLKLYFGSKASSLDQFSFAMSGLVGFYLLLKMTFFLFHPQGFVFYLLALSGFSFVIYASYKMLKNANLKDVVLHFSLMNFAMVLVGMGFFGKDALQASLIYIANGVFVGIVLFVLMQIIHKNLLVSKLFLSLTVCAFLGLPISLVFWANWHLSILSFNLDIGALVILPIILTSLVSVRLVTDFLGENNLKMKLF